MKIKMRPSHVALLVPSVRKAADFLSRFDFQIGDAEIWEGEGTKEIYVEKDRAHSLLLMEPTRPGAYQRALDKRGPGLHHLAIDVLNLEEDLGSLAGSGWLLHPSSLRTIKQSKTAYLARPGFPALIEVQQKDQLSKDELFVTAVSLPFEENLMELLEPIGLEQIVRASTSEFELRMAGQVVRFSDLIECSEKEVILDFAARSFDVFGL